jgi:ABC-2 type transport system permease protein
MSQFLAVLHARNLEFLRDRAALLLNLVLPIFLVIALAFTFPAERKTDYKVGVLGGLDAFSRALPTLAGTKHIAFIAYDDPAMGIDKVRHFQIDALIDVHNPLQSAPQSAPQNLPQYWVNNQSSEGYLLERIIWSAEGQHLSRVEVTGKPVGYVDWFLPGILGMNIMFSCIFSVGFVIVRYRKNGFLKRLKATPLSAPTFLLAQLTSRLLLILTITTAVFAACSVTVGIHMQGSYWDLLIVTALGAMSMISIGLLIAARTSSEEFAGGIINAISWPMMLLSGAWFSLEGASWWIQDLARIFPLTHFISAARAIIIENASLSQVMPQILGMAITSVILLFLGAVLFKWE